MLGTGATPEGPSRHRAMRHMASSEGLTAAPAASAAVTVITRSIPFFSAAGSGGLITELGRKQGQP